ncbi:MAG: hypothetical protein WCL53_00745 [Chloroflexota bacterium]
MTGMLLLALLLVLLFGGLGIFVAKAFFIGLLVVLALAFLGGTALGRRRM